MRRWWQRLRPNDAIWSLVLLGSAACVLEFRHFASLDGPMHVLHARILEARWSEPYPPSNEVWYEARSMPIRLGELMLLPATTGDPAGLHMLFATIALLVFTGGAWALARAYGVRVGALFVWCLPLAFGFLLVLGLFHFLIGVGACMACAAIWARHRVLGWRSPLLLIALTLLCVFAHRGVGLLFGLLVVCHEVVMRIGDRTACSLRWARVPGMVRVLVPMIAIGALVSALPFMSAWYNHPITPPSTGYAPLHDLLGMRCMRLFAEADERMVLNVAALLFALCLLLAIRGRIQRGRAVLPSDMPALAALVLLVAAFVLHSDAARAFYAPERAVTVALVLLVVWMALQPVKPWLAAIGAVLVLVLHVHRLRNAETVMASVQWKQQQANAVADQLAPGSNALTLLCEDNWLLGHVEAGAAARHTGVLITHTMHVPYRWQGRWSARMRNYVAGVDTRLEWFAPHCETDTLPTLQHVIFFGHGNSACAAMHAEVDSSLARYYNKAFDNGYAVVWDKK